MHDNCSCLRGHPTWKLTVMNAKSRDMSVHHDGIYRIVVTTRTKLEWMVRLLLCHPFSVVRVNLHDHGLRKVHGLKNCVISALTYFLMSCSAELKILPQFRRWYTVLFLAMNTSFSFEWCWCMGVLLTVFLGLGSKSMGLESL